MSDPWDPFTAAHQAIFTAFKSYATLTALVLPGNVVDTTDPHFLQFKPDAQSADTPRLKILQDQFTLPPFGGNSTTVLFTQSYRVLFLTDVLRIVPLNQLKYLSLIALIKAGPTLGQAFIKGYEIETGKDDFKSPRDETQRSQRWTAAFTINVHLYLQRHTLAGM